ncbi:MAG: prepilin-type N-terminal cleavage/methylation domain-containing protein [Acidobacteria bacterium]|nr:prepilin-type N-terminal cleavage/methylation domain-containing protein [Acidobacteriota bacterium]
MRTKKENGFSLIELLLVVVIIGVLAALAVPALRKAQRTTENGATIATLRTISSTQVSYYTQNRRFGRLPEINTVESTPFGTTVGDRVVKGEYVFEMAPTAPTDENLQTEFTILATRNMTGEDVVAYELNQTGRIRQVLPFVKEDLGE